MAGEDRRAKVEFTERRQRIFLDALEELGNVADAATRAGVTAGQVHGLKRRDEEFAGQLREAADIGFEVYVREAHRRGVTGVDEPVYYQGEPVGVVRKYSDKMLEIALKAGRPEVYSERHRHVHGGVGGGPIQIAWLDEDGG